MKRALSLRLTPRHSRESGNPEDCSQASHPKSSINSSQRIPFSLYGLAGVGFGIRLSPVIPAEAGIQRVSDKFATGNQVQTAASGSPLPLWERARARRAQARLMRARRPRSHR